VGAGGRGGYVGRQLGVSRIKEIHHWGGGLGVDGLDEWPTGLQVMGSETDRMFFVFPQKQGKARLYLNFPTENRLRYAGPDGATRFLADFDVSCVPRHLVEMVLRSNPIGPCMTSPSLELDVDPLYRDGVVLIGDEAGANDPVLGTGLSNAFRDVRLVVEAFNELGNGTVSDSTFIPYVTERKRRLARLNFASHLISRLSVEFGPGSLELRRRAWSRMRANPAYMVPLLVSMAGPDRVPEFSFSSFLVESLLADERTVRRSRPRLADLAHA
jgi:menaquinone-9 beta-reductase